MKCLRNNRAQPRTSTHPFLPLSMASPPQESQHSATPRNQNPAILSGLLISCLTSITRQPHIPATLTLGTVVTASASSFPATRPELFRLQFLRPSCCGSAGLTNLSCITLLPPWISIEFVDIFLLAVPLADSLPQLPIEPAPIDLKLPSTGRHRATRRSGSCPSTSPAATLYTSPNDPPSTSLLTLQPRPPCPLHRTQEPCLSGREWPAD